MSVSQPHTPEEKMAWLNNSTIMLMHDGQLLSSTRLTQPKDKDIDFIHRTAEEWDPESGQILSTWCCNHNVNHEHPCGVPEAPSIAEARSLGFQKFKVVLSRTDIDDLKH